LKSAPAAPTTGTSAGTLTQRWRRSPQNSATISPRHIATQITADDLAWADDVLVMDDENHQQLARRYPNLIQHVRLLDATAIPDLWLVDQDPAYADSLDRIEQAARTYLANLQINAERR
jgi:protein-tyrosine-phosphatase